MKPRYLITTANLKHTALQILEEKPMSKVQFAEEIVAQALAETFHSTQALEDMHDAERQQEIRNMLPGAQALQRDHPTAFTTIMRLAYKPAEEKSQTTTT